MADSNTVETSRAKRPLGVWILTIYALVFAGILPLVIEFLLLVSDEGNEALILSLFSVFAAVVISFGIVLSSLGTWLGSNRARLLFLIFVTLHYVLIALNGLMMQFSGGPDIGTANVGRILMGILFPAIYIWYFRRTETKRFFR